MACINKNCRIESDDERMLCCWLCHGNYHFKCTGLRVTVAEAVSIQTGLHWCCIDCRKIGVSFYRFFQGTKNHFQEIQEEASKLADRISIYGKLFDDFKSLDSLSSPQSSPKRRKSSKKDKTNNEKPDDANFISPTNTNSNDLQLSNSSQHLFNFQQNPPLSYAQALTASAPALNSNSLSNSSQPMLFSSSNASTFVPPASTLNSAASTSASNAYLVNTPKNLKVVSKKKTVFAARFAAETSEIDVSYFIKEKLGIDIEINVFKFTYAVKRNSSSFKIIVPEEVFDKVVNPSFWPAKALIKEYIYKENDNIAHLPSRTEDASKNY